MLSHKHKAALLEKLARRGRGFTITEDKEPLKVPAPPTFKQHVAESVARLRPTLRPSGHQLSTADRRLESRLDTWRRRMREPRWQSSPTARAMVLRLKMERQIRSLLTPKQRAPSAADWRRLKMRMRESARQGLNHDIRSRTPEGTADWRRRMWQERSRELARERQIRSLLTPKQRARREASRRPSWTKTRQLEKQRRSPHYKPDASGPLMKPVGKGTQGQRRAEAGLDSRPSRRAPKLKDAPPRKGFTYVPDETK